ncbi:hypothetical protein [Rhodococcus sp. JG-3]|uniref:hypothetical protein n=1 Tax=Rhodococcus sp. JG-3 TaxID=1305835 RepID=UPI00041EB41B|nr:hypothetical protein [Rhodococcus sp. JG-3]
MKVRIQNGVPVVEHRPDERRSVVMTIAGLEFAFNADEAVALADQLVDAAERSAR